MILEQYFMEIINWNDENVYWKADAKAKLIWQRESLNGWQKSQLQKKQKSL